MDLAIAIWSERRGKPLCFTEGSEKDDAALKRSRTHTHRERERNPKSVCERERATHATRTHTRRHRMATAVFQVRSVVVDREGLKSCRRRRRPAFPVSRLLGSSVFCFTAKPLRIVDPLEWQGEAERFKCSQMSASVCSSGMYATWHRCCLRWSGLYVVGSSGCERFISCFFFINISICRLCTVCTQTHSG